MIDFSIMKTVTHPETATVADLRNNFRRVSAWIDNGQSVMITRRGVVIADLVPRAPSKKKFKIPDLSAWKKKVWGDRVFTAEDLRKIEEFELEGQEG